VIKASESAKDFIRKHEGFVAQPYDDGFGNKTIGYGDTEGDLSKPISQEEAEGRLSKRIQVAEEELNSNLTNKNLSQGQMDVLVDMHYNLGLPNMKGMLDRINRGDIEGAGSAISEYVYAKDKFGRKVVAPGLVKRSRARSQMWGQPQAPEILPTPEDNSDLFAVAEEVMSAQQDPNADLYAVAEEVIEDSMQAETPTPEQVRKAGLEGVADLADDKELAFQKEVQYISKQTGLSLEEVEAQLTEKPGKYVIAESRHDLLSKNAKAVSEWAMTNPANYALMAETGDWPRKIEHAAKALSKEERSNWNKVLRENATPFEKSFAHIGWLMGSISQDDAFKRLRELDQSSAQNQLQGEDVKEVSGAIDNMKIDDPASIWEAIKAAAGNKEAFAQIGLQSFGSSIAPLAGALGMTAVATPAAGIATAVGLGAAIAFQDYMTQQLDQFRDPKTGLPDYELAASDPARVSQWRKEAGFYAGTIGAIEGAYSKIAGKVGGYVSKNVFKAPAKTAAGKAGQGAVKVAAETVVKQGEEAAGEAGGLTAADLYAGRLTPEKAKENLDKGVQEGFVSIVGGAAIGGFALGARKVLDTPKKAAIKTLKAVDEVNKANDSLESLSKLRAVKDENPAGIDNPEQTDSLIDTVLLPPTPEQEEMGVVEDIDALIPGEVTAMEKEADIKSVSIAPSEWFKYHELKGSDPFANIPADIAQVFAKNKISDSSVQLTVSQWLRMTEEDPEIETIARVGSNQFNGVEANEMAETFESNPKALFETDIDISGNTEGITFIEPDGPEGNIISRPVKLIGSFRDEADKKVFQSLVDRIKNSNEEGFDPEYVEQFAEFQFRHMKGRAEILGQSIEEVAKRLRIGKTTRKQSTMAHGVFMPNARPNDPYSVVFSKTANVKTIIHEFGHSWLHEMSEDWAIISKMNPEEMTVQQLEYKAAMETAAELYGLSDIGKLYEGDFEAMGYGGARKGARYIHESFAQTAELYFLEGKFENSRILGLMEAFRGWVLKIAHTIAKTYPEYPATKISPKVERMFEAILNISNKVEEEVTPMFPEPMFDPKMLGADGQKYIETILDARSEAVGRAYTKAFNRSIKEREAQIDKEIDRIYAEATQEVDGMRSMIILAQFQGAYEDFKNGTLPADPRLSYDSIARVLAKGDDAVAYSIKEKVPQSVIAGKKKGGMDITLFMHMNGIHDPREMQDLLLEMGRRDKLIEQLATKKIDNEFPVMKTDEEIHEIAVAAVNAGGKEKLLAAELKILATKYLATLKGVGEKLINPSIYLEKASKENMKFEGAKIVLGSNAYRFSASKYLVDSHRLGRQAARMFKQGNLMEAFDYKLKEAIHYFAYLTAKDAQTEIAKTRARVKQIVKYSRSKDAANIYDADVMTYGRQVIQAVGTKTPIPAFSTQGFSRYSAITEGQIALINNAVKAYEMVSQGKSGNDLDVGGYLTFGELIRAVMKVAKDAKTIEIEERRMNYEGVASAIASEVTKKQGVVNFKPQPGTFLRRSFVNTRALFDSLYGSTEEFAKSKLGWLYSSIVNAEAERNIEFTKGRDRIAKAVKNAVGMDKSLRGIVAPIISRGSFGLISIDKSAKPVLAPELGFTFANEAEVWYAYLLMGSESGAEKFLLGHNAGAINPATGKLDTSKWDAFDARMQAEGKITKKHFDMFQEIWNVFQEVHPKVKSALRKSDGFLMGEIKGKPFSNQFGTYTGGYVPVSANTDLSMGATNSLLNADTIGYRAQDLYPSMNTGMSNERTKQIYRVNLDMSRVTSYLSAAMNIAYLRNPMLDFGRIIESQEVTGALELRRPGAIEEIIVPWFNAVKKQEYTEMSKDGLDQVARGLRKNVNMALYFANFISMAKQVLGSFPAISKVGARRYIAASVKQAAAPRSMRQEIMAKSKVMTNRIQGSQQRMVQSWERLETTYDWASEVEEKAEILEYFGIQFMQNMVDVSTWKAAYDKGIYEGMTEDKAVNYADMIVNATQSTPDVTGFSNFQRGKDVKKLFTMVTSVPIAMNNLMSAESMRDAGKVNKAKTMISLGMLAIIAPTLLETAISEGLGGDEDEEEEDDIEKTIMTRTALGSLDAALPFYGRLATSAAMFGNVSISPALSKLNKLPVAGKEVYHGLNGVDFSAKGTAALMDTLTIYTGMPFAAIGRGVLLDEALQDEDVLAERSEERRGQLEEFREE
jgi:GH24 family phage-related lysozyme (muramidase)